MYSKFNDSSNNDYVILFTPGQRLEDSYITEECHTTKYGVTLSKSCDHTLTNRTRIHVN